MIKSFYKTTRVVDIAAVVCCGSTRLAHLQSNPSTFLATFKLLQIKLSRTFNGIQVRAFLLVVLKVVHHEGCVFGVVVMLEDKAATQTQLCCRLLQGSRFSRFLPLWRHSLQISTLVIVCHCGDCVLSPNISSVSMASSLWPKDGLPVCIVFLQVVFSVSQSDLKVSAQFPLLCFLCRVQLTVFLEITIVTVLLGSLVCRQLFWDLWMHLSLVFYFLPL